MTNDDGAEACARFFGPGRQGEGFAGQRSAPQGSKLSAAEMSRTLRASQRSLDQYKLSMIRNGRIVPEPEEVVALAAYFRVPAEVVMRHVRRLIVGRVEMVESSIGG